ncbi:hypothetical protein ACK4SH_33885, partial [Proteus mirabilis]
RRVDPMRPLLPPDDIWLNVETLNQQLKQWPRIQLKTQALPEKAGYTNLGYQPLPDLSVNAQSKSPLDNLRRFQEQFSGSIVFSVE